MADDSEKPTVPVPPAFAAGGDSGAISTELSSRRTGMSFQRTRMSADRTLMSVIRTSLSLISFGFTIYQFFEHLQDEKVLSTSREARNFGVALIYIGIAMVAAGIAFHIQFMIGLRHQRESMVRDGLIHGESHFPASFTLMVAILLFLLGIAAIASVVLHAGPLS